MSVSYADEIAAEYRQSAEYHDDAMEYERVTPCELCDNEAAGVLDGVALCQEHALSDGWYFCDGCGEPVRYSEAMYEGRGYRDLWGRPGMTHKLYCGNCAEAVLRI